MSVRTPFLGQRYAFVVAGAIFIALLAASGLRAAPGVLLLPWHEAFGWDRGVISFAIALGIFFYGLVGPFAAALMMRFGVRIVLAGALAVMSLTTFASAYMSAPWQLIATWGVLTGLSAGCVSMTLAATIVNRWFVKNRGLMTGLLTASVSTGTLIFLPLFANMTEAGGWRPVVLTIAVISAVLAPLALLLIPERPESIGLKPWGAPDNYVAPPPVNANPARTAITALVEAAKKRDFWLLFGTFFVCGFTTNGLIGTHMIALCADNGMAEVRAAGLLAAMGVLDLIGTTASGWLTDRYDPRKLLFVYYGLRGLSLIYLPFSDFSLYSLSLFTLFYGLDWIATVPPTLKLANKAFGDAKAPIVFGWVFMGHQLGAASAAFFAGSLREIQGNYLQAFVIAGMLGVVAAFLSLMIGRSGPQPTPVPAAA